MIINYEHLVENKARSSLRALFRATFGDVVTLTREVILEHGAKLDVDWVAANLLAPDMRDAYYAQHRALYDAWESQHLALWAAYEAQFDTLQDAYEVQSPRLTAASAACKLLRDAYEARKPLLFADVLFPPILTEESPLTRGADRNMLDGTVTRPIRQYVPA